MCVGRPAVPFDGVQSDGEAKVTRMLILLACRISKVEHVDFFLR